MRCSLNSILVDTIWRICVGCAAQDKVCAVVIGDLSPLSTLTQALLLGATPRFNGGGHMNHDLFWKNLKPTKNGGGGAPSGRYPPFLSGRLGKCIRPLAREGGYLVANDSFLHAAYMALSRRADPTMQGAFAQFVLSLASPTFYLDCTLSIFAATPISFVSIDWLQSQRHPSHFHSPYPCFPLAAFVQATLPRRSPARLGHSTISR